MSRKILLFPLLCLAFAILAPALAEAQQFYPIFQKFSADDDDVDERPGGFPPSHPCPLPCESAHFVLRIINCGDADCVTPNAMLTGGEVVDEVPITFPIDCAAGVMVTGDGTADPPICDAATNTITVQNINVAPGGTLDIDFYTTVDCESGVAVNQATLEWDQNPMPGNLLEARDPASRLGSGYRIQVGDPAGGVSFTKDAPALSIGGMPAMRQGAQGSRVSWVINGGNPLCDPLRIIGAPDISNPPTCQVVDCDSLRLYIDDIPTPLPAGTLCPDPATPALFSLGEFEVPPGTPIRIEYDSVMTSDPSVPECCNYMDFTFDNGIPNVQTSDPRLDVMTMPEATCVSFEPTPQPVFNAIKAAEDMGGRAITSVQPGDTIYWRFTLENNGDEDGMANLDDDFPALALLDPASIVTPFPSGSCMIVGQNLNCTGVMVAAGGSVEMVVSTVVDCAATGGDQICNVGNITGDAGALQTHCPGCPTMAPGNDTCVDVGAPVFDFASKTATDETGDGAVDVGETITWSINPLNSGSLPAIGTVVEDVIPPDTSYVPGTLALDGVPLTDAADGDDGEVVGGVVTVRIGDQNPVSGTGIVTFDTVVDAVTVPEICNENARVNWSGAGGCPDGTAPIPAACMPTVAAPVVTATKTVDPEGEVERGAALTFRIEVCNEPGGATATGVELADIIPNRSDYVAESITLDGGALTDAADGDEGEYQAGPTERILVAVGDVLPGECRTVSFDVVVEPTAMSAVVNKAQVSADGVPEFDTNLTVTDVTVPDPNAMTAVKTVDPTGGVDPDATLLYSVEVCNGPMAPRATGVTFDDLIPAGTTYVADSMTLGGMPLTDAADADAGVFNAGPPASVSVAVGSLDRGACTTVSFEVTVDTDAMGSVTNAATVASDAVMEFDSNMVTNTINSANPPNLTITKSSALIEAPPANPGETLSYTLSACNDPAAGVADALIITDPIPLDPGTGCGGVYVADSITVDGVAQTDAVDGDFARYEAAGNGQVVVEIPSLDPGECVDVVFEVTIDAGCDDAESVDNTGALEASGVPSMDSNTTRDMVTVASANDPVMLRHEGLTGLVDQCPDPMGACGCEVGPRLDEVADDCLAGGTCTVLDPLVSWTVPGEQTNGVSLVFYEVLNAGCMASGDADQLEVEKSGTDDVIVRLVVP